VHRPGISLLGDALFFSFAHSHFFSTFGATNTPPSLTFTSSTSLPPRLLALPALPK
jgi:hypothetical protein